MLSVLIFNGPTSTTTLEDLTGLVRDLRFSTQLHGGFNACRFHIDAGAAPRAWSVWLNDRHWHRLGIYDGASLIWEGRKEVTTLTAEGLQLTFFGYWANLADHPHLDYRQSPPARITYNANERADDVFKDVLAKLPASHISTDTANIARPSLVVANGTDPLTFDGNESGQRAVMTVANWSDRGDAPWYAAIWDGRKAHLARRGLGKVDYHTMLSELAPGWSFKLSTSDYYSDVYADYLSGKGSTLTALATDADARARYGRRTKALLINRKVPASVAEQARDTLGALLSRPRQFGSFAIQGAVYDSNRRPTDLYRVRAGGVLRIDDLVPALADLDAVTLDGLRTFYILATDYDHDRHVLRIRPDLPHRSLSAILQRENITG